MADPLSIAGLAAGAVSLGIQVCSGVQQYLDHFDARTAELQAAGQQVSSMRNLLNIIETQLKPLHPSHGEASGAVMSYVSTCQADIDALNDLICDLKTVRNTGLRNRMSEKGKKLMYPFDRSKLKQLESRLEKVNSSLQTALQALGLELTSKMDQKLTQVVTLLTIKEQSLSGPATSTSQTSNAVGEATRETFSQLMSKPSYLNECASKMEVQAPALRPKACPCRSLRSMSRKQSLWGQWVVSRQETTLQQHISGCRFAKLIPTERATEVSLQYLGLRRLANTAIKLSLSITRGAGGYSISPVLSYFPIVDEKVAPAFRIINLTKVAVQTMLRKPNSGTWHVFPDVLRTCVRGLSSLYYKGAASPRDTDSNGSTVLHRIACLNSNFYRLGIIRVSAVNQRDHDAIQDAVLELASCGVPGMQHDLQGESAAAKLFQYSSHSYHNSIIHLLSTDPGAPLFIKYPTTMLSDWRNFSIHTAEIADSVGCGPLSLAIVTGDIATATRLLAKCPSTFKEVNALGQTPLHLATRAPHFLKLLVDSRRNLPLEAGDRMHKTPLDYAVRLGLPASVQILVDAGCLIPATQPFSAVYSQHNPEILEIVIRALKKRRDQLSDFGRNNLPPWVCDSIGLGEAKTLDYHAFQLQRELENHDVEIPVQLTGNHRMALSMSLSNSVLDSLWAHGFRDIDYAIEYACAFGWMTAESIWWFIQHGADIWTPFGRGRNPPHPQHGSWTPAHFFMARMAREPRGILKLDSSMMFAVDSCSRNQPKDDCYCLCSSEGCTPFTLFLKQSRRFQRPGFLEEMPEDFTGKLVSLISTLNSGVSRVDQEEAVRVLTFQLLEIEHTCCRFDLNGRYQPFPYTREDADEVNEEQEELVGLFESLMAEFIQMLRNISGDETSCDVDYEDFWKNVWSPRMIQALHELESAVLTPEDLAAAESIGVEWGKSSSDTESLVSEGPELSADEILTGFQEAVKQILDTE